MSPSATAEQKNALLGDVSSLAPGQMHMSLVLTTHVSQFYGRLGRDQNKEFIWTLCASEAESTVLKSE